MPEDCRHPRILPSLFLNLSTVLTLFWIPMQPGFQTHLLVWYCGNSQTLVPVHVRVWNMKVELKCVGANRLFVCVWSKNQANNHCNNPILLSLAGRWSRIPFVRIPIFKVLCLFLVLEAKSHLFEIPFYRETTVVECPTCVQPVTRSDVFHNPMWLSDALWHNVNFL